MALLSPSLQSFTLLLDETSSTFSVARVVIPGSEVFIPRASQLRHIWHSPVWKFFSIEYAICKKCSTHMSRGSQATKSYIAS